MYIVIIVFYLKVKYMLNGNKRELMIIKELFEKPVGDYCFARNTIKWLFTIPSSCKQQMFPSSDMWVRHDCLCFRKHLLSYFMILWKYIFFQNGSIIRG